MASGSLNVLKRLRGPRGQEAPKPGPLYKVTVVQSKSSVECKDTQKTIEAEYRFEGAVFHHTKQNLELGQHGYQKMAFPYIRGVLTTGLGPNAAHRSF